MCRFEEALQSYIAALVISPNDILALKGVGDVNLALAYQAYSLGSMGDAGRCLSKGVAAVDAILKNLFLLDVDNDNNGNRNDNGSNNDSNSDNNNSNNDDKQLHGSNTLSVWKLMGDLCTFSRNIGPSNVSASMIRSMEYSFKDTEESSTGDSISESTEHYLKKEDSINGLGSENPMPSYIPLLTILKKGENSYRKMLEIILLNNATPSAAIYFDIGCALYSRGIVELQSTGQGSGILPPACDTSDTESLDPGSRSKPGSGQLFVEAKDFFLQGDRTEYEAVYFICSNSYFLSIYFVIHFFLFIYSCIYFIYCFYN